jgi:hypothetical protein
MGDWPGRQLLGAVRVSFAGEYAYTWEATGDEFQKLMGEVAGNADIRNSAHAWQANECNLIG